MSTDPPLRTLQLVTTPRPFFDLQVKALERNGVSCTVLAVPGSRGRSIGEYLRFQLRVLRRSLGTDFDLIQANFGLTGPAALAQPRRPVVLSLWGSELWGTYERVIRATASLADAVTVVSPEMADSLDRDCHVVRWGIDTELFRPMSRQEARADLGWDPGLRHVLFPYDPDRPVKDYPRAESVVGTVDDELDDRVELQTVHGVAHERMPVYMNAADALLLTSKKEGSPNAVKEALACNVPVVSTDVGDVDDLVDGIHNAFVRSSDEGLADRLAEVLASGERSDGRERIQEHGLEQLSRDLLAVYDEALDGSVRPPSGDATPTI